MPLYLYKIQPVRPAMLTEPTPEESAIVGQHFAYLKDLLAKGVLLLAGRTLTTDYSSFGIGIFKADDDAAMQALAANDPAVAQRVMRAEWYPYRVALLAEDWQLNEA
jgi:uncharacterized protein YciI